MVSQQTNSFGRRFGLKGEDGVYARSRVSATINVIPEEDNSVTAMRFAGELVENLPKRNEVAMDVTDDEGGRQIFRLQQSAEYFRAKAAVRSLACATSAWNRGRCRTGSRNGQCVSR